MIKQHFPLGGNYSLWEVHVLRIKYCTSFFVIYLATEERFYFTLLSISWKSFAYFLCCSMEVSILFPWAYKTLELVFKSWGKFDSKHCISLLFFSTFMCVLHMERNAILRHHCSISCSPCIPGEKTLSILSDTEAEHKYLHSLVIPWAHYLRSKIPLGICSQSDVVPED